MKCKRREELRIIPKVLAWVTRKLELSSTEMRKNVGGVGLGLEQKFSFGTS